MNANDPDSGPRGEETTDWPIGQNPPAQTPPEEEATRPTPARPRGFHEETTLDAAQFLRSQQQRPPSSAPPSGPPPVSSGPAGPTPWATPPHQPGPGGYAAPYQQPAPGPTAFQRPPAINPVVKPTLAERVSKHRWWVIGGAAALVVVLVIVLVAVSGGNDSSSDDGPPTSPAQVPAGPTTTVPATPTAAPSQPPAAPPPPPPGPVLAVEALPGLLLPPEQVSQRMNAPGMAAGPVVHRLLPGAATPERCTGAWGPAYEVTYRGSGFTGVAVQGINADPTHKVVQAVVSFPDTTSAKEFYIAQGVAWNVCKSEHIRYEYGGVTEADIGVPAFTGDILSVMIIPTTSKTAGQQCERDMTVRGNVVVDVRACSPTVGSAGLSIARAIADKIAPAP